MGGGLHARAFRAASILAIVAALLTAATAGAGDPDTLRDQAQQLEAENAELAGRERSAVLDLYALETRLARTDRRLAALRGAAAEVEDRRAATERRLQIVRNSLAAAEESLAERLRTLYVEGDPDPVEILLGARSLDEALTALDSLGRLARQDREIVEDVQAARSALKESLSAVKREEKELARLTGEAEAARSALAAARAEQRTYLAGLREERRLNATEIGDLLDEAAAAEAETQELQSSSPAGASPPAATDGRRLTVVATGYALHGATATGIPTGWGVVAVDPDVIPLGTRMTVPGYGEGVAADTGGAVQGNKIDLWFPTREQALAWGVRTVTITLH